jgi:hypothetical protein
MVGAIEQDLDLAPFFSPSSPWSHQAKFAVLIDVNSQSYSYNDLRETMRDWNQHLETFREKYNAATQSLRHFQSTGLSLPFSYSFRATTFEDCRDSVLVLVAYQTSLRLEEAYRNVAAAIDALAARYLCVAIGRHLKPSLITKIVDHVLCSADERHILRFGVYTDPDCIPPDDNEDLKGYPGTSASLCTQVYSAPRDDCDDGVLRSRDLLLHRPLGGCTTFTPSPDSVRLTDEIRESLVISWRSQATLIIHDPESLKDHVFEDFWHTSDLISTDRLSNYILYVHGPPEDIPHQVEMMCGALNGFLQKLRFVSGSSRIIFHISGECDIRHDPDTIKRKTAIRRAAFLYTRDSEFTSADQVKSAIIGHLLSLDPTEMHGIEFRFRTGIYTEEEERPLTDAELSSASLRYSIDESMTEFMGRQADAADQILP